jgi:uncharacterized protein YdeI (YjbR/CyaY-like superfamily)
MTSNPPLNSVHPKSRAEWRLWLEQNHTRTEGIWLVGYKKDTGKPRMEYNEAVEEAICFGWVDSKPNKLDDERSLLWFAPRKPGTGWSRINKERVEKLIQQGLMAPAGMQKVNAAKQDGSWTALDEVENLEIPPDLAEGLASDPVAQGYFEQFPRSTKRAILEWIASAKKPETRLKRIKETIESASRNIRANQWRQ